MPKAVATLDPLEQYPQVVYTNTGSVSYVRLWGYTLTPGMLLTAYDGVYNWAAAPADTGAGGPLIATLVNNGSYPLSKKKRITMADGGMTITIINPPNDDIPVLVTVYYIDE